MNKSKHLFWLSVVMLSAILHVDAQENQQPEAPPKYRMDLVYVIDGDTTEYIFVIGSVGFKSVDSLKKFLSTLPPGSMLEWAPGCRRSGNEPLLSSPQDMEEFKAFCVEKIIKFALIPSG